MRFIFIALLSFVLCSFTMNVGAADRAVVKGVQTTPKNPMSQSLTLAPKSRAPITKDPSSLQMPVHPIRGSAEHTGRLIVMYAEEVGMRAPRVAGTDIFNLFGADTSGTIILIAKYGSTIRQAIDVDPVKLDELRDRASLRSGKQSQDLASMMLLEGIAPSQLLVAAREFLALPDVSWVEIEKKTELAGPQGTCGFAPNFNPLECGELLVPCPECGCGVNPLPCNYPHPAQFTPGPPPVPIGNCSDAGVCTTVNAIRPSCATCWDQVCATFANLLGPSAFGGQSDFDTCLQTFLVQPNRPTPYNCPFSPLEESILIQTSPFIAHPLPGASNPDCCRAVCFQDVTCCTVTWDSDCAALATGFYGDCYSTPGIIGFDGGSPLNPNTQATSPLFDAKMLLTPPIVNTPGSLPLALYTTSQKYADPYSGPNPPPPPPPGIFQPFINVTGFRAGGLDLDSYKSLLDQFPGTNGPQLRTISVAVIEPSGLVNHEDLIDPVTGLSKITVESGQTPLVILDQQNPPPTFSGSFDTAPSHGTATFGVLFANDNTIGVTGIVPDAQAFFFPTETFESQGRLLTAMTNAINQLSLITEEDPNPGNIIVLPISQNGQPLNTDQATAALITTGLNLGVTFVLAAGNASQEILPAIEGTGNAIVVGAVWPGFQFITEPGSATVYPGLNYCRANLSNFSGEGLAIVGISAWGKGVCTLGYGDLFSGQNTSVSTYPEVASYEVNRLRTYTAVWGGTSAAAAQIGGVTALIQALAKQVYEGLPLSPGDIQTILYDTNGSLATKFAQCGLPLDDQPGYSDARVGNTLGLGDGEPSPVGGFPRLRRVGVSVITGSFYDENSQGSGTTFEIICGTLLAGTQFSIREIDDKFVKARTARPQGNQAQSSIGPPLFYPSSNRILDVQIIRETTLESAEELTQLSVRVTGQTISVSRALVLAYLWNYDTNRWNVLPPYLGNMTGANVSLPQFTLPACLTPSAYGFPSTDGLSINIAARVVIVPIGGLGQAQIWLDQIAILFNDPLGTVGAPCGGGNP
ncbi:MAG: S8 family serine peptidase [Planctomycetota bacterium]|nr:S8 family serine peptidase [Planctomycetota bacterium]